MLAFVGIGVVVETLFNVIMPLSLKFLIDDALGEEDFQALYKILGVLAVGRYLHLHRRGLVREMERAAGGRNHRRRPHAAVRPRSEPAVGVLSAHQTRRNPVALLG